MFIAFISKNDQDIIIKEGKSINACRKHLADIVAKNQKAPYLYAPGTIFHIKNEDGNIVENFVIRSGKSNKLSLRKVNINKYKIIERLVGAGGFFKRTNKEVPGWEFVKDKNEATKFYDDLPLSWELQNLLPYFTYLKGVKVIKIF